MSRSTMEYFGSLDMPPLNFYGMSETSGAAVRWARNRARPFTSGTPIDNIDFKIDNPDKDGNGEICMRGRSIFMGYLNNEKATREAVDEEGFLHSGDIG